MKSKVRPIKEWCEGMHVHDGRLNCRVVEVKGDVVKLHVANGLFYAHYNTKTKHMLNPFADLMVCRDFFEVIHMSPEDYERWYNINLMVWPKIKRGEKYEGVIPL